MAKKITFDTVKRIGLALPGVEESGAAALKVNGYLMTCPALNKSAEPDSIVVRVSPDQRTDLIAEAPETYYVTDHYVDYDAVLVRLSCVEPDLLKDVLRMSWQFVTAKKRAARKTRRRS
jgi:hypothetical protein